jgi:hypothetical protein
LDHQQTGKNFVETLQMTQNRREPGGDFDAEGNRQSLLTMGSPGQYQVSVAAS